MFLKVDIQKRRLAFALYRMAVFSVGSSVAFLGAGVLRGYMQLDGLTLLLPLVVLIFLPIALTSIFKAVSDSVKDQLIHAVSIILVTGVVVYFTVGFAIKHFFGVEEAQIIRNLSLTTTTVLVGSYIVAALYFGRKESNP